MSDDMSTLIKDVNQFVDDQIADGASAIQARWMVTKVDRNLRIAYRDFRHLGCSPREASLICAGMALAKPRYGTVEIDVMSWKEESDDS